MHKRPLWVYVVGVVVVLGLLNWYATTRGGEYQQTVGHVSLGFLLGLLAMYIAVHLYRWK